MTKDQLAFLDEKMIYANDDQVFYASLGGPLWCVYYPLPFVDDTANALALNNSKLKELWCSIHIRKSIPECADSIVLPVSFRHYLNFDHYKVGEGLLHSYDISRSLTNERQTEDCNAQKNCQNEARERSRSCHKKTLPPAK